MDKNGEKAFAFISVTKSAGKTRNTIETLIPSAKHSMSYSPTVINAEKSKFILHYPLRCLLEKEDNFFVVNNEQLDIIGTGETQEDAEKNFNEEFEFLYKRLNSLGENKLSNRLLNIKNTINNLVKQVI